MHRSPILSVWICILSFSAFLVRNILVWKYFTTLPWLFELANLQSFQSLHLCWALIALRVLTFKAFLNDTKCYDSLWFCGIYNHISRLTNVHMLTILPRSRNGALLTNNSDLTTKEVSFCDLSANWFSFEQFSISAKHAFILSQMIISHS